MPSAECERYKTELPLEITCQQGSSAKVALCFAAAGKANISPWASMCKPDTRQEKSNTLRLKPARRRAETGAVAASKEGLKAAGPVHDPCMTGHDKSNALQAEKEGLQRELAQCQIDKQTVTANRDELQAARTELAAQLATTEAKVGPLKDICASDQLEQSCRCKCTCSIGIVQRWSLDGSISSEAGRTMPETRSPRRAADTEILPVSKSSRTALRRCRPLGIALPGAP